MSDLPMTREQIQEEADKCLPYGYVDFAEHILRIGTIALREENERLRSMPTFSGARERTMFLERDLRCIMLNGISTGRKDAKGVEIKCGDRVSYYEFKEEYIETQTQDGWGRNVILCRHDQYKVPKTEKTIYGTVVYDPVSTGFVVKFEEYMLDTCRKDQPLHVLLFGRYTDRLLVI